MNRCGQCTTVYADGLEYCPLCRSTERRGGTAVPSVTVVCGNTECGAYGKQRRVMLTSPAVGVVAVPGQLLCARCGSMMPFVSGWPPRPNDQHEEETVPKITRHGGPTIAGAQVVGGTWSEGESRDAWPEAVEPAPPAGAAPEEETVVEAPAEPAAQEHPGIGEPMEPVEAAPDGTETEIAGDGEGEALPPVEAEAPERPSVRDPRSAWLAYAKATGVEGADQMTKAQLIETTKA